MAWLLLTLEEMKNLLKILSALVILSPACAFAWPEFLGGKPAVSVDDYNWIGEKPSESLFQNLYKHSIESRSALPEKGTTLTRLSLSDMPDLIYSLKDDFQIIEPSTAEEKALLVASTLDTNPHEVGQLFIKTDKKAFASQLLHGNGKQLNVDFEEVSDSLYKQVFAGEFDLVQVTFIHTHPVIQFSWKTSDGKQKTKFAPLSAADIRTMRHASLRYFTGIPVRIKAVSPEGFTYSKVFKDGRDITLESLSIAQRNQFFCYMDKFEYCKK